MTDIVERLRRYAGYVDAEARPTSIFTQAADEIERLTVRSAAADEIERLRAQNARLMARGIEDMRCEIERLTAKLATAEAVIAEHDRARATVSPPPCACPAHIAWRQRSGR